MYDEALTTFQELVELHMDLLGQAHEGRHITNRGLTESKAYLDFYLKAYSSCYSLLQSGDATDGGSGMFCCTCPAFVHYAICKHSLGYAIYLQKVNVPLRYSIQQIDVQRGPGRAKKARGALERMPEENRGNMPRRDSTLASLQLRPRLLGTAQAAAVADQHGGVGG